MQNFGRDVTEKFCKREGLGMVVRSHQFKKSGRCFELMHDGWLMRVFSARNYCGKHMNDGGFLLVGWADASDSTLLVKPQAVERIAKFELHRGETILEPYCPSDHLMQLVRVDRRAPGWSTPCLPLASKGASVDRWRTCDECGHGVQEDSMYFVCRGCGDYCLCLKCASASSLHRSMPDDSDSDSDSGSLVREVKAHQCNAPALPVVPPPPAPRGLAFDDASSPRKALSEAAPLPSPLPVLLGTRQPRSPAMPPTAVGAPSAAGASAAVGAHAVIKGSASGKDHISFEAFSQAAAKKVDPAGFCSIKVG